MPPMSLVIRARLLAGKAESSVSFLSKEQGAAANRLYSIRSRAIWITPPMLFVCDGRSDVAMGTPYDAGMLVWTACQELEPWSSLFCLHGTFQIARAGPKNNSDRSLEQHIFWRLHFASLLRKAKNTSDIQSTIIYYKVHLSRVSPRYLSLLLQ